MAKIEAPFTEEQIEKINAYQNNPRVHPFTCGSPEKFKLVCFREKGETGMLEARKDGLHCNCGQYVQKWVHDFMAE